MMSTRSLFFSYQQCPPFTTMFYAFKPSLPSSFTSRLALSSRILLHPDGMRPMLSSERSSPCPTPTWCAVFCTMQSWTWATQGMKVSNGLGVFNVSTPVSLIHLCFGDYKIPLQRSAVYRVLTSTYGIMAKWYKFQALWGMCVSEGTLMWTSQLQLRRLVGPPTV